MDWGAELLRRQLWLGLGGGRQGGKGVQGQPNCGVWGADWLLRGQQLGVKLVG